MTRSISSGSPSWRHTAITSTAATISTTTSTSTSSYPAGLVGAQQGLVPQALLGPSAEAVVLTEVNVVLAVGRRDACEVKM